MSQKKKQLSPHSFPIGMGIFLFLLITILFACQPQVVEVEKEVVITVEVEKEIEVEVEVTREVEVVVETEAEVEAVPTADIGLGSQPEVDAFGSEEGDGSPFVPGTGQKVSTIDSGIRTADLPSQLEQPSCAAFVSNDLTPHGEETLPGGMLQLAVWYETTANGTALPSLYVGLQDSTEIDPVWLRVDLEIAGNGTESPASTKRMLTQEFLLLDCVPAGLFLISNNGEEVSLEGLAFGIYFLHPDGSTQLIKSRVADQHVGTNYVGLGPVVISTEEFEEITPQLSHDLVREQARALIYGAQFLDDGLYEIR